MRLFLEFHGRGKTSQIEKKQMLKGNKMSRYPSCGFRSLQKYQESEVAQIKEKIFLSMESELAEIYSELVRSFSQSSSNGCTYLILNG